MRHRVSGTSHMRHPLVGTLHLRREKLAVNGTDGRLMVVYHAEPGSEPAQALAILGSIAAGAPHTAPGVRHQ